MNRAPVEHQLRFSISRLVAWAPGVTSATEWHAWARGERAITGAGEPALQQMAPMLRRHAGRLGRLACSPAYDSLADFRDVPVGGVPVGGVPMVFSARYGEVSRSVELLTAMAMGEELSPTTFGLSVHNAVPGLFGMARKETANAIALSAGNDSAECGVIEACGLLEDGAEQVLLVVADCPLPELYRQFDDSLPIAFGWSCLIKPPTVEVVSLSWRDEALDLDVEQPREPSALAPLRVLLGEWPEVIRYSQFGHNDGSDPRLSLAEPKTGSDPKLSSAEPKTGSDPRLSLAEPKTGSDPKLSSAEPKTGSDPRLSSAHHTQSHPTHRIWRWSRNA